MAKGIITSAMHAKAWNAARKRQISNAREAEDARKESREKAQRKSSAKQAKAKKAKSQQSTSTARATSATKLSGGHTTRIIEGPNVREVQFAKAGKKQKPSGHTTRIIEGANVREVQFEKARQGRRGALDGLSRLVSRLKPKRKP